MVFYILFEASCGYSIFERLDGDEIGELHVKLQKAVTDFGLLSQMIRFVTFQPFTSPDSGLENINDVSEGVLSQFLKNFLETNFPKSYGEANVLGVIDPALAGAIKVELGITTDAGNHVAELCRCIRMHFDTFLSSNQPDVYKEGYLIGSQRGLGHAYSRAKIMFNANRSDNMIIQAICLLDQLDKDINTLSMRIREWYSWHFPELNKMVKENELFVRVAYFILNRQNFDESKVAQVEQIVSDPTLAQQIYQAAKSSTGYDISDLDIQSIERFATRVVGLVEYRSNLSDYLVKKMNDIAPNTSSLMGEIVGARLINKAGSLITLAKYPASTIQILGAEKALFRALKARKGNTPKYGLIFNSSFIGRAKTRDKGRISRYLANKCAIAARIDAFYDYSTHAFGKILNEQVEERLSYYDSGVAPEKNEDIMKKAIELSKGDMPEDYRLEKEREQEEELGQGIKKEEATGTKKKKRTKKRKVEEAIPEETMQEEGGEELQVTEEPKKRRKKKKIKQE